MNQFVWKLINYRMLHPQKWVVVHCTHGFNRTGTYSRPAPFFCCQRHIDIHYINPIYAVYKKLSLALSAWAVHD